MDKGRARIGIIGGSGLYEMEGLRDVREVQIETPFGAPSDAYVLGDIDGETVAFLPRHGRGHRISPTELNSRANIFGFKVLGVERLIAVSAVGSMREEIHPLDLVIPDQLIDRTRQRVNTFFGDGIVAHVGFADPFCAELSGILARAAEGRGVTVHPRGTYVCIEGPQFSTRAESRVFQSWGASVIGMTALPEARLAREAEICYAMLALATDYDVWHESEEVVTVEMVVANLLKNVDRARQALRHAITGASASRTCNCGDALRHAIMTRAELIPAERRAALAPLLGRYVVQG